MILTSWIIGAVLGFGLGMMFTLLFGPPRPATSRNPKVCKWRPSGEPPGLVQRKHHMRFQFMTEDRKWSTYRCGYCGHEEIIPTPTINVHSAEIWR